MPRSQPPRRKRAHAAHRPTRRDALVRGVTVLSETLSVNRTLMDCAPGEQAARIAQLRDAVEQLRKGTCTGDTMSHLIDAANIAGFRLDDGDFANATLAVFAAKEAVISLYETLKKEGRYIARGHELRNLTDFINYYEIMMQNSTPKEWNTAQRKLVAVYAHMTRQGVTA